MVQERGGGKEEAGVFLHIVKQNSIRWLTQNTREGSNLRGDRRVQLSADVSGNVGSSAFASSFTFLHAAALRAPGVC